MEENARKHYLAGMLAAYEDLRGKSRLIMESAPPYTDSAPVKNLMDYCISESLLLQNGKRLPPEPEVSGADRVV